MVSLEDFNGIHVHALPLRYESKQSTDVIDLGKDQYF